MLPFVFHVNCRERVWLLRSLVSFHSVHHSSCSSAMQLWRLCACTCRMHLCMWGFVAVCAHAHVRIRGCVYDLGGGNGLDVMSAFPGWKFPDDVISILYWVRACVHACVRVCVNAHICVLLGGAKRYRKGGDWEVAGMAIWPPVGMRIGNWSQMKIDMKWALTKRNHVMTQWWRYSGDISGDDYDCVFDDDDDKDYSLVFGEARIRLCNTRTAAVCVFVCVCMRDVPGLALSKSCSALVALTHTHLSLCLCLSNTHTQMGDMGRGMDGIA